MLLYILVFTLLGSILSLLGGVFLLFKKNLTEKISHFLISFAAGVLLGTAFFDLLPEALGESDPRIVFGFVVGGFLFFFIMERFIHWAHHHPHEFQEPVKPTVPLIMFGDSIHNFIDGIAIAATFLVDIKLGIITSLAVAAHEIPQEIGDFAVMLKRGIKPRRVLLFNFFSALTAIIGALITYVFGNQVKDLLPFFIAVTAGFFLYISATDLVPEIHEKNRTGFALFETALLVLGVITVYLLVSILE